MFDKVREPIVLKSMVPMSLVDISMTAEIRRSLIDIDCIFRAPISLLLVFRSILLKLKNLLGVEILTNLF